jgi:hypothetical protein
VADSPVGRSAITLSHWALLGSLRFGREKATPEIIARELGFEVDAVHKMLGDLEQAGFDITPNRDRSK